MCYYLPSCKRRSTSKSSLEFEIGEVSVTILFAIATVFALERPLFDLKEEAFFNDSFISVY